MPRTIFGARLAELAADATRGPAWIDGDRELGFDEVAAEVASFAAWLVAGGVSSTKIVGVSIADDRLYAVASVALLALGVPQVTLPTSDPLPMREALARRLRVERVLADAPGQGFDGAPATLVPERATRGGDAGPVEALSADPDATALYVTSSGTTGRPKILGYSQRSIALRAESGARVEQRVEGERVYVPTRGQAPLARSTRLYSFLEGVTSVIHDGSTTAAAIIERCNRTRTTIVHLSALLAANLAIAGGPHGRLGPGVKVFSVTARLQSGIVAEFERNVGGRLYDRYGTTEVGIVTSTFPRGDEGVPDSVGRIVPLAEVEIVDANGDPVPPGAIGQIRARTPQMTTDYVDDLELTRRHFRDGWFHPGDMGAITADGVVRFLGRHDDMMSLAGFNIFPAEIERALDAHPAVREAAAFPVRSALLGDIPVAAVELRASGSADAAALLAFARERLGVRAPRRVFVVETLPRNASGKVLKFELARRFEDARFEP